MKKVIFVCHGNICRSPMAEFIFRAMLKDRGLEGKYEVSSAAVSCEEIGNPVYPPARAVLAEHGISCRGKTARRITEDDYYDADLIIAMDSSNLRYLSRFLPANDKTHLLLSFAGESRDVADPWYTDDFETCFDDIVCGCSALLDWLEG